MSEIVKELLKAGGEILGGFLYEKSLTRHAIEDLMHHDLARVFLNNIHCPSVLYAFSPLQSDAAMLAVEGFCATDNAVPIRRLTKDDWNVVAAARKPLTLREQFKLWVGPDFQPHLLLVMLKDAPGGCHVYAGCRFTDPSKANLGNWLGKAAAERSYGLLISTRVGPPIQVVTSENADTLP
jgi:hypothetical protein